MSASGWPRSAVGVNHHYKDWFLLRCGLYFFHTTNSERRAPPEKEKKSHFESTSKKNSFFCFWPDVSTDQGRDQLTRTAQLRCQNRGQKNIIKPDRLWRVSNGKKNSGHLRLGDLSNRLADSTFSLIFVSTTGQQIIVSFRSTVYYSPLFFKKKNQAVAGTLNRMETK